MPELTFNIVGAEVATNTAGPTIGFSVRVVAGEGVPVVAAAIRCQVMIETAKRRYSPEEKAAMSDLFGTVEAWERSLRPLVLAQTGAIVPGFEGESTIDLLIACTYDVDVASTRYLEGLESGDVPLIFLFSGSVHVLDEENRVVMSPIAQHTEARYRLPVTTWRRAMDAHFPNASWLRVRRDVMHRLVNYKSQCALPTWEIAFERLLAAQTQVMT